jgi:hypothetical protein
LSLTKKIHGGLVRQYWKLLYYSLVGVASLAGAIFIVRVINIFKIIIEIGLEIKRYGCQI